VVPDLLRSTAHQRIVGLPRNEQHRPADPVGSRRRRGEVPSVISARKVPLERCTPQACSQNPGRPHPHWRARTVGGNDAPVHQRPWYVRSALAAWRWHQRATAVREPV
jgi:hypothetical protein